MSRLLNFLPRRDNGTHQCYSPISHSLSGRYAHRLNQFYRDAPQYYQQRRRKVVQQEAGFFSYTFVVVVH